jgi:serine carboxypeptidase-like clade 2
VLALTPCHMLLLQSCRGPGCSSLGGGFLAELGPFYPTPGGQELISNDFCWCK